jgi:hypothetical protein
MADDRNLRVDQRTHQLYARTLNLDGLRTRLLHKADRVRDTFGHCPVIATEGHVGDHQRTAHATAHRPRVMEHFVDRNGERVFLAEYDHSERVADQDEIDTSLVSQSGG